MKHQFETLELPNQIPPSKQEWALINHYKALQFDKLRQKQRLLEQEKKNNFRHQLDEQRNNKNDVHLLEAEADKKYYDFITKKAQEIKKRQEKDKQYKMTLRKQMQQQNQHFIQEHQNSRIKNSDSGYHLDIGEKSQQQRRNRSQIYKKQMMDTLDLQIRDKEEQKKNQKVKNKQQEHKNLMYQYNYFDNRNPNPRLHGQSPNTYKVYQKVVQDKYLREKQLEKAYVERPAEIKKKQAQTRQQKEQQKKTDQVKNMKQVLNEQIREQYHRKTEQARTNPEQLSYGVISNIFREKPQSYNKDKYYQQLKQQMEQQQYKKKRANFMSAQEYKLNMNQLSKVVNGDYAHKNYIDRSLGVIGDGKKFNVNQIHDGLKDKDADSIKHRLDILSMKHKSGKILPYD